MSALHHIAAIDGIFFNGDLKPRFYSNTIKHHHLLPAPDRIGIFHQQQLLERHKQKHYVDYLIKNSRPPGIDTAKSIIILLYDLSGGHSQMTFNSINCVISSVLYPISCKIAVLFSPNTGVGPKRSQLCFSPTRTQSGA